MTPAASKVPAPGSFAPILNPIPAFTPPATNPLSIAIWTGSPPETFRVRLLSIAQARHAPPIAIAPHGAPPAGRPVHDSTIPPAVINAIPAAIRLSKFSLNTNQASAAVSTPSRFNSSDALDAAAFTRPHISNTGPATPPAAIAPASHGQPPLFNRASRPPAEP